MTGAALAAALVARGLSVDELARKQPLFELVVARLDGLGRAGDGHSAGSDRSAAVHAWWVPGRLEVFGTHTDYAGGHTLVCAVPRGFAVIARRRNDNAVHVVDALRDQEMSLIAEEVDDVSTHLGWRRYVAAVCRRLARNFPAARLGVDIVIASDLPRASGMSSSSALVVAVATALVEAGSLRTRVEWQRNVQGPYEEAGYYACMENGLSFGSLDGDAGVGTHGGSEDHAAILAGTPGHLSAFTFVPMRARDVVPIAPSWQFVLTPSGVPAQKTGIALEAYNRLADDTRTLLELWSQQSEQPARSLRAALKMDAAEALDRDRVARLQQLIVQSKTTTSVQERLASRLLHFVREDFRTIESIHAFRRSDQTRIGQLAADSQSDAEVLLGNQIPETIALAAKARTLGAFAARSFGAGFGGSVWALVDAERAEKFARQWSAQAFVALPGPPVLALG